jgi:hypothetical protein
MKPPGKQINEHRIEDGDYAWIRMKKTDPARLENRYSLEVGDIVKPPWHWDLHPDFYQIEKIYDDGQVKMKRLYEDLPFSPIYGLIGDVLPYKIEQRLRIFCWR